MMYWEEKWDNDGLEVAVTAGHPTFGWDTQFSEVQSVSTGTKKLHHKQPPVLLSFSVQICSNTGIFKNYTYLHTHKTEY